MTADGALSVDRKSFSKNCLISLKMKTYQSISIGFCQYQRKIIEPPTILCDRH